MTIEEIKKAKCDIEATADLLERAMPKMISMTWAEWQESRAAKRANLARLGLDMPSRRETDHGTAGRRLRKAFAGQRVPKFAV